MFGSKPKRKTTLAQRVKKKRAKLEKRKRIAALKAEDAKLTKMLRGY
jgi:hypothetical protein